MEKLREDYRNLERFYAEDMNKMTHIINSLSDNAQVFITSTSDNKIVGEVGDDIKIGDVIIDDGSVVEEQRGFIYKVEGIREEELTEWLRTEFSSLTENDDTVICAKFNRSGDANDGKYYVMNTEVKSDLKREDGIEVTVNDESGEQTIVDEVSGYTVNIKPVEGEAFVVYKKYAEVPTWLSVKVGTSDSVSFCDDATQTSRTKEVRFTQIVTGVTAYTTTEIVVDGVAVNWLSFKPGDLYFKAKNKVNDSDVMRIDFIPFVKKTKVVTVIDLSVLNDGSGGGGDGGDLMVNVTYSQLKSMRDNNTLVPGQSYRIIDYMTTTTQEGTQSAGHPFDVVVRAISTNILSEVASAVKSSRDTNNYFEYCKLEAWKLWYCLDNDEYRFSWADTSNGKGVIYRMIDENNNDVPYDFKNIQFIRYKVTGGDSDSAFYGTWQGPWLDGTNVSNFKYHYTFTRGDSNYPNNSTTYDSTVYNILEDRASNNTIKRCSLNNKEEYEYRQGYQCAKLNNIVFIANFYSFDSCGGFEAWTYENIQTLNVFEYNCYNMTFNGVSEGNRFLNDCYNFSIGSSSYDNSFGAESHDNSMFSVRRNKIGNDFKHNVINRFMHDNVIGNNFNSNTIGDYFPHYWDEEFRENTIGNYFYGNRFNDFNGNLIGNNFSNNIGFCFTDNIVGNNDYYNKFPNSFYRGTIGNDVYNLNFTANYSSVFLRYVQIQDGYHYSNDTIVPSGILGDARYQQTIGFNSSVGFTVKSLLG